MGPAMTRTYEKAGANGNMRLAAALVAFALVLVALVAYNPDEAVFRFLAMLLFGTCVFMGMKEGYPFNPYYLFSLTPLSLAIYEYDFSPYYLDKLEAHVYVLALCNIAAFLFGLALVRRRAGCFGARPADIWGQRLFYPLLALGMMPVIYGIVQAPGVFLSWDFLGMGQYTGLMPMSSILMFCRFFAIPLAFESGRKGRVALALSCCTFALLLSFNKTNLTFLLGTVLICLQRYCLKSRRSKRAFGALCVAVVVALVFSVTFYDDIRSDYDSTEALIRTGSSGLPDFLMLPYMYLENSWTNLQYVIETQPQHTWGLWFFRPILFYLRLDGFFSDAYTLVPSSAYNTYTYITIPWKDFGFAGSVLVSFLLGLFVSFVYQRFRRSGSPFFAAAWALNAVAVLEMFFSNHFFYLVYPFTACIIALLCDAYVGHFCRSSSSSAVLAESSSSRASGEGGDWSC